uniref:hypothetical protein n=1 Tax=Larkinella soli TaxID=1770527 RepID=UPI0013E3845F
RIVLESDKQAARRGRRAGCDYRQYLSLIGYVGSGCPISMVRAAQLGGAGSVGGSGSAGSGYVNGPVFFPTGDEKIALARGVCGSVDPVYRYEGVQSEVCSPGTLVMPTKAGGYAGYGGAGNIDGYYNYMAQRSPAITFTDQEKLVIQEYSTVLPFRIVSLVSASGGSKPDGSKAFVMSAADVAKYPRLAEIVRSLRDYVIRNPKVMYSLKYFSGFSENKILELLKFGKGPTIVVEETERPRFGHFIAGTPNLYITARWVRGLEKANLESTKQATAFLLAVTLLHEFVHYGRDINQLSEVINGKEYEMGSSFEIATYGVIINKVNAGSYSYTFVQK